MKEKSKKFLMKSKNRLAVFGSVLTAGLMSFASSVGVYAGATPAEDTSPSQAGGMLGTILGIVTKIFQYIGILLCVWAIGQLILAFKNEDADSKSRAMMLLVAAVCLIAIRIIVDALLTSAGTKVEIIDVEL